MNWLLMIGLLGIAAVSGVVMTLLMWSASLPPQDDVFMENHIIDALVLLGLAWVGAGNTLGLGRWWTQASLVRRFPWRT